MVSHTVIKLNLLKKYVEEVLWVYRQNKQLKIMYHCLLSESVAVRLLYDRFISTPKTLLEFIVASK